MNYDYESILSEIKARLHDQISSQIPIDITADGPETKDLNAPEDILIQYLNSNYELSVPNREGILVQNRTFRFAVHYRIRSGEVQDSTLTGKKAKDVIESIRGYTLDLIPDASPIEITEDSGLGRIEPLGGNVHSMEYTFKFDEAIAI